MALELVAGNMGLPESAAQWLQLIFCDSVVPQEQTLYCAGLKDADLLTLAGEDEARATVEATHRVNLFYAARNGVVADVESVCQLTPERVHDKQVSSELPLSAPAESECAGWINCVAFSS